MAYCQRCNRTHATDEVRVAGSRFTRPTTYRAQYDGSPIRPTREEAQQDLCGITQKEIQ